MTQPVPDVMPPSRRPLSAIVLETLRSVTGRPIDITNVPAPETGAVNPAPPYAIIYPIPGGAFTGGPLQGVFTDGDFRFQVTSVGIDYIQCEWMADRVRRTLLGRNNDGSHTFSLNTDEYDVILRESESGPGDVGRVEKLYSSAERFRFVTTPT